MMAEINPLGAGLSRESPVRLKQPRLPAASTHSAPIGAIPARAAGLLPGDVIIVKPRKAKGKSPTARTLEHLRKTYPLVQVVERWNPHAKVRVDLFGIIDVVAVSETEIVAVQSTSGDNVASRVTKIAESDALPILLKVGIRVIVHGWRKNAAGRWVLREVEL